MRIDRFQIGSSFDTGDRPLGDLVIVHGTSDTSEQRLLDFLGARLLDLWSDPPAADDRAPSEATIQLRTGGGDSIELGPRSSASVDAAPELSPDLFRTLFAPDGSRRGHVGLERWGHLREELVTGLEPEALTALYDEAGGRELAARARALGGTRDELRARRALVESRRTAARERLRRLGKLRPVHYQLGLIETWRRRAGDVRELESWPEEPLAHIEALRARRSDLEGRVAGEKKIVAELAEIIRGFTEADCRCLQRIEEVDAALDAAGAIPVVEAELTRIQRDLNEIRRNERALSDPVLERPITDDGILESLDFGALARLLQQLEHERRALSTLRAERDRVTREDLPLLPPRPWVMGLVLATGVVGLGAAVGQPALAMLATLVAGVGGIGTVIQGMARREIRRLKAAHASRVADLDSTLAIGDRAVDRFSGELRERLAVLPVRASVLDNAGPSLCEALSLLRELRGRKCALLARRDAASEALAAHRARLDRTARELASHAVGDGPAERLRAARSSALRRKARADQARRDRQRRLAEIRELEAQSCAARDDGVQLHHRLEAVGDAEGDIVAASGEITDRWRHHRAADWLEGKIRGEVSDLQRLRQELSEAERERDAIDSEDETIAGLVPLHEELTDDLGELDVELYRVEQELEILREASDSTGGAAGELATVLGSLTEERRELESIADLVGQADRTFQRDHQPPILSRANENLWRITGCHPNDLCFIDEEDSGALHLRGRRALAPAAVLALRLSLVDHFDAADDALPILLHEPLHEWPESARARALSLLREQSRQRQVFLFTSQPEALGFERSAERRRDQRTPTRRRDTTSSRRGRLSWRSAFGDISSVLRSRRTPGATGSRPKNEVALFALELLSRVGRRLRKKHDDADGCRRAL